MTDSLDEILSANQKLYVLNQKLTEEVKRLREALSKIADPRKRDHKEPDKYTELGCVMHIAELALERK